MPLLTKAERQRWRGKRSGWPGKKRMASAGGQLLGAAFAFIGEMFPKEEETEQTIQLAETFRKHLSECLDKDDKGPSENDHYPSG